jgi:hypothetical protein
VEEALGRRVGRIFESGELLERKVLRVEIVTLCVTEECTLGAAIPWRTNMIPAHNVGSPGVRLMKTPCGQAVLRPELFA